MNSRKYLFLLLAAVLVMPQVWKLARQILWQSTEELQSEIDSAQDLVIDLTAELDEAMAAQVVVQAASPMFFPSETSAATTSLQKWVYDCLQAVELEQSTVTFGDAESGEGSTQLMTATLSGEAPLQKLNPLLISLLRGPSGIRCSQIELASDTPKSGLLRFEIRIEALAIESGSASQLPQVTQILQELASGTSKTPTGVIFASVKVPEVKAAVQPPPVIDTPPRQKVVTPPPVIPSQLVFVGSIVSSDKEEVIFFDPADGSTQCLKVGEEIVDNSFSARILAVSGKSVMLRMSSGLIEVQLSESLSSIPQILWNASAALPSAVPPRSG